MVQVAPRGTSGDYGARRLPGTLQEAVRRTGQEAAGRRVRRKLLPPARRAPWCGAGLGRRAGGVPEGRSATPAPCTTPGVVTPRTIPSWGDAKGP